MGDRERKELEQGHPTSVREEVALDGTGMTCIELLIRERKYGRWWLQFVQKVYTTDWRATVRVVISCGNIVIPG